MFLKMVTWLGTNWCWFLIKSFDVNILFFWGWCIFFFFGCGSYKWNSWDRSQIYQASNLPHKISGWTFHHSKMAGGMTSAKLTFASIERTRLIIHPIPSLTWLQREHHLLEKEPHIFHPPPPFLRFHVHFRFVFAQLWMALAKKMYVIFCGSTVMGIREGQKKIPARLILFNDQKERIPPCFIFSANNPFEKGIPGMQTTNPNQQLTISPFLGREKKHTVFQTFFSCWNPVNLLGGSLLPKYSGGTKGPETSTRATKKNQLGYFPWNTGCLIGILISADPSALPEGEAQGKREAWTACQLVPDRLVPASFSGSTASLASPCMVPDRPLVAS